MTGTWNGCAGGSVTRSATVRSFSLRSGTIVEGSSNGLDKWLQVVWLMVNCKNRIGSHEMARLLAVTQRAGWFVAHRMRGAPARVLCGTVKVQYGHGVRTVQLRLGKQPPAYTSALTFGSIHRVLLRAKLLK